MNWEALVKSIVLVTDQKCEQAADRLHNFLSQDVCKRNPTNQNLEKNEMSNYIWAYDEKDMKLEVQRFDRIFGRLILLKWL